MIKVCVVVASRANYGRVKYLMKAIQEHEELELQLIVGASTLLERFGKAINVIRDDGFVPDRCINYVIEGETLLTQAKSTGLGMIELSTAISDLDPDFVVSVADRFETMATALAATYMNIPLIHIQGGEVSGNIDDRVRHAITKLADFHFVATECSRQRVIRMGESEDSVFNFGCPSIDVIRHADKCISNSHMSRYGGVGTEINWENPYILVIQHPVTTSYGHGFAQIKSTLDALNEYPDHQKVVLWPNSDAGGDDVSRGIRTFRESNHSSNFHFYKNFSAEDFVRVMANASCVVGNSSSFLREGAFLGVPAVCIGDRQNKREHGANVRFVDYDSEAIVAAIGVQLEYGSYPSDSTFGSGNSGIEMAKKIPFLEPKLIKPITY